MNNSINLSHNTLALGDNLELLKLLPNESIDLIYLDPPFNSQKNYIEVDSTGVKYFRDVWRGGSNTYLEFMFDRLVELHRVLKNTGSIVLHCDPTESHYIKIILDKIFGRKNFRNEIVWHYVTGGVATSSYPKKHDILFWYSKSNKWTFNVEKELKKGRDNLDDSKVMVDGKGSYTWYIRPGTNPKVPNGVKSYIDGYITDTWIMPFINNMSRERTGYPTQKPLHLLERVLKALSNERDIVLDPFMGSGTTLVAAEKLNRKFIGFDRSGASLVTTQERLDQIPLCIYDVFKLSYSYDEIRNSDPFVFEKFIVERLGGITNEKQRGDMGIDGRILGDVRKGISVKRSDNIGRNVVDNFVAALQRERMTEGIIVAFSFGKGAYTEASRLRAESNINIELVEVKTIIKINIAPIVQLVKENNLIKAIVSDIDGEVINYTWWCDEVKYPPAIMIDKTGIFDLSKIKGIVNKVIVRVTDDCGNSVFSEINI